MGLYFRKSISVGGIRFNFSSRGIGVSAGIKGLRFGVGPRGYTVSAGSHGLYYRTTTAFPRSAVRHLPRDSSSASNSHSVVQAPEVQLSELSGGNIAELTDSSSAVLINEICACSRRLSLWPMSFLATLVCVSIVFSKNAPNWAAALVAIVGILLTAVLAVRDAQRKTVVVFYDVDSPTEQLYESVSSAIQQLGSSLGKWHIDARGNVRAPDRKYYAGASTLVKRTAVTVTNTQPPSMKTNIDIPRIQCGRRNLFFLPDRLLVYEGRKVGSVSYANLSITIRSTRWIETERVVSDTQVIDQTWKYVNAKGGPDRRFKDNRQIPVCLYDEVRLQSSSGLNEVLHISKAGSAQSLPVAVNAIARGLPIEMNRKD